MKKKFKLYLCLLGVMISINLHAMPGYTTDRQSCLSGNQTASCYGNEGTEDNPEKRLTGLLLEKEGIPIPFASISLYSVKDSTFIGGGICDEEGRFEIPFSGEQTIVKISCVGYKNIELTMTALDMGTIYMSPDTSMLGEVTVVGHRKLITRENGQLTLDIQNSNLKNIGKARDAMKYIPGMVSVEGKYEVFGKGEPVVYLDGRKVRNASELSLLASSNIKSVKLITNPGAEYDAATRAVVAITTMRRAQDGLSSIVNMEVSRHKHWADNEDINLNLHHGDLDVFLAYRHDNTKSDIQYDVDQTNYGEDVFHEVSASEYSDRSRSHDFSAGMNYNIGKNHAVGGKYMGTFSDYKLLDSPYDYIQAYKNGELLTYTDNKTDESEKERFHNVNLYYTGQLAEKVRLNMDADYVYTQLKSTQLVTETSRQDGETEETNMRNDQYNRALAFKGVFSWDMTKSSAFDFGADFSRISSWGTSENEEGKIENDDYKNTETKYAGFVAYRLTASKWSAGIGLRYEYVRATNTDKGEVVGRSNYSDFLPSLALSTSLGRVNVGLDFSSRVNRPSFRQLNNSVSYNNQYHYEQGNVNLKPQYVYDTELSVNYGIFDLKLDYQYIKDYIHPTVVAVDGKPGTASWMSTNAKKFQQLGAQCVISPVFGCWRPILTAGIYKPDFALTFNGEKTDYNHPYGILFFQNAVEQRGDWLFRGDFYWNIKGNHGIYEQNSHASFNLMAQKQLLHKRLTITLKAEDVFNWSKLKDVKKVNFVIQNRAVNNFNRCIIATISYNLNSFKDKYNGRGAAEDEINRF